LGLYISMCVVFKEILFIHSEKKIFSNLFIFLELGGGWMKVFFVIVVVVTFQRVFYLEIH
jgi:hypothetical protein